VSEDVISVDQNQDIVDRCLDIEQKIPKGGSGWLCNTYNTLGTLNLLSDNSFNLLIKSVEKHVNEYATCLGSEHQYKCQDAWTNISYKYSYQEYHAHAACTISAVYYASMPEGSSGIYFQSPLEPDMMPLNNVSSENPNSFQYCSYNPKPGTLIIFRSYLKHMVPMCQNTDPRITIALNF
jgi:uncharacterized protein (TIGR02466 family)